MRLEIALIWKSGFNLRKSKTVLGYYVTSSQLYTKRDYHFGPINIQPMSLDGPIFTSLLWFTRCFLSKHIKSLLWRIYRIYYTLGALPMCTSFKLVQNKPMMLLIVIKKKDKTLHQFAICPETKIKNFLSSSRHVKSIIYENISLLRMAESPYDRALSKFHSCVVKRSLSIA